MLGGGLFSFAMKCEVVIHFPFFLQASIEEKNIVTNENSFRKYKDTHHLYMSVLLATIFLW